VSQSGDQQRKIFLPVRACGLIFHCGLPGDVHQHALKADQDARIVVNGHAHIGQEMELFGDGIAEAVLPGDRVLTFCFDRLELCIQFAAIIRMNAVDERFPAGPRIVHIKSEMAA